jgi:hypothetical protein
MSWRGSGKPTREFPSAVKNREVACPTRTTSTTCGVGCFCAQSAAGNAVCMMGGYLLHEPHRLQKQCELRSR